ncbi:MAG: hypothetical protein ACE5GC_05835 [Acidimicrobiia bacterium]
MESMLHASTEHAVRRIVLVGVGEMGGIFARGALRTGHSVYPVRRSDTPGDVATQVPDPRLVLVTVGEADLGPVLADIPGVWRDRLMLLQNELLPRTWEAHGLQDPTVAVVWFEKKPGTAVKAILPSPIGGPRADLVAEALAAIRLPARVVADEDELEFELVRKNLYILTSNIAGLETGGTVGELWRDHRDLATSVADEVLDIQQFLVGRELDRDLIVAGMVEAFDGDPDHGTKGRSAPARLRRALLHADQAGLPVPTLRDIASRRVDAASV